MPELIALGQVLFIDIVLAGDNAIVVGMAVAGLPAEQKNRAIVIGIAAATVMRIGFALITVQLLAIVGLMLAGGLLLLWVCWKMYRDLRRPHGEEAGAQEAAPKTMRQAGDEQCRPRDALRQDRAGRDGVEEAEMHRDDEAPAQIGGERVDQAQGCTVSGVAGRRL